MVVFTKTPCKMDVRKHPHAHIPTSHPAAPGRSWVYLRPSQNGKPDASTTLIADTRGPRCSELGTSTPAVPPRLRHDAVVNANTGPGLAGAHRVGAALRSSVQGAGAGAPASSIAAPQPPGWQQRRLRASGAHAGHGGAHIHPVAARATATLPSARAPAPRDRSSRGCPAALTGLASRGHVSFRHPPHRPHRSQGALLRGLFC